MTQPNTAPVALGNEPELAVEPRRPSVSPGRDGELLTLLGAAKSIVNERLLVVEGPAGIGKEKLLGDLRSQLRLDGGVVLEGRCDAGAFGAFTDIVQTALRFLSEVGRQSRLDLRGLGCRDGCHALWHQHGAQGHDVGEDFHGATPETAAFERKMRFFDTVGALLQEVARVRAPVIVLHHLENADRGTLELLQFLIDGSGALDGAVMPALFVASLRTDVAAAHADLLGQLGEMRSTTRLSLRQLDRSGVRAYLTSETVIARVLERTGGHPELIDLLLEAAPLTPEARTERRLQGMSREAASMLRALAVLGRPTTMTDLARVTGGDVDRAHDFGRSDLLAKSIVDGELRYAFERARDREACYALIPEDERQDLHLRAVELCAGLFDHEGAVRHAMASGNLARAADLALLASASLAARHAHGEAAALLEALVKAAGDAAPSELRNELADLYRICGNYGGALVHARAILKERPREPVAAQRVGYLLTVAGELDEARDVLTAALELAEEANLPRAGAEIEAQLAELHYQRGEYVHAARWAESSLARASSASLDRIAILARNTLGKLALAQKNPSQAAEFFESNRLAATDAGLGHQEAQAYTNLAIAHLLRRDLPAAETTCRRAIEVATLASDTRDRAIATENLAVLAHLARDYGRAHTLYLQAVALLRRLGNKAMLARVATNLGELYLSMGDRERARTFSDTAQHLVGPGTPPPVAAERLCLRGRIALAEGRSHDAREAFRAALSIFRKLSDTHVVDVEIELIRVALEDGDLADAAALLDAIPDQEGKRGADLAYLRLVWARGAGADDASRLADRAIALARATEDEERILQATIGASRAKLDDDDVGAAARLAEAANALDESLTSRVPVEFRASYAERAAKLELLDLAARLATLPERRDSRAPRPLTRGEERWAKRFPSIAGGSAAIQQVLGILDKVASADATVLIRGESGTGKELIAEALHQNSPRANGPLVKVNCAALVETLLLSELFGHERGAFTGAQARKKGRFELADGGTLFLDEIGDISPKTQAALLRVLQERQFERVGGTQSIRVDVRIVAATHRDLEKMVRDGSFREDLYYRLRGVMLEMPALRRRLEDLPILCERILARIADERGETVKAVSAEALTLLAQHRWPGNVRELENLLRSATLFADGDELRPDDFAAFAGSFEPLRLDPAPELASPTAAKDVESIVYQHVRGGTTSLFDMKKRLERECIVRALEETNGNITRAASLLGMKRPRLSQLVKEYELGHLGK